MWHCRRHLGQQWRSELYRMGDPWDGCLLFRHDTRHSACDCTEWRALQDVRDGVAV